MNSSSADFVPWLIIWALIAVALVIFQWQRGHSGVGLLVAYLAGSWLNYWVGAFVYALPWFQSTAFGIDAHRRTLEGFALSTQGLFAFAAGAVLCAMLFRKPVRTEAASQIQSRPTNSIAWIYIALGVGFTVLFLGGLGQYIGGLSAILTGGQSLILAGLCLMCWDALQTKNMYRLFAVLTATIILLPVVTVSSQGLLGYGVSAAIAVVSFVAVGYRPRWQLLIAGFAGVVLGMSVYVGYMKSRDQIRAVTWAGAAAGIEQRLSVVGNTLAEVELFDFRDQQSLNLVDHRLNMNYLVGSAMDYTPKATPFANGETLWLGVVALVPRALWPDKPYRGGSMGYVSEYTGIVFALGTSVGMGQVFEFFINFGHVGVWLGMFVLGGLISWLDARSAVAVHQKAWLQFTMWYLPGVALLQVGGSIAEMSASAAGALVVAWFAGRAIERRNQLAVPTSQTISGNYAHERSKS